jgi:hypothetical protein
MGVGRVGAEGVTEGVTAAETGDSFSTDHGGKSSVTWSALDDEICGSEIGADGGIS